METMRRDIRPVAVRSGITSLSEWHILRDAFCTLIADVATAQALMRLASSSLSMNSYIRAVTPVKRDGGIAIVGSIPFPRG